MDIPILFENDDVLVINKPSGVMVHPDGVNREQTVVDWFLERCSQAKGVGEAQRSQTGEELERSGIVHRLDKDTSGVLILAKTEAAYTHLKVQFHDRLAKKEYRAFVYGPMRERWGTIDRPIGRSAKDFRLRSAQHGARGTLRAASTNWECIGTGQYNNAHFSYLKLQPKSGRTHQIRVHLQAIGKPVVLDALYAKGFEESNNLELTRMALHAHVLDIILPGGEERRFLAPVPQEFEEAAERIATQ